MLCQTYEDISEGLNGGWGWGVKWKTKKQQSKLFGSFQFDYISEEESKVTQYNAAVLRHMNVISPSLSPTLTHSTLLCKAIHQ